MPQSRESIAECARRTPRPPRPAECALPAQDAAGRAWTPIIVAYCVYLLLSFLSEIGGGERHVAGAVLFLVFMAMLGGPHLFPLPLHGLTLALLLSALLPAVALLSGISAWYTVSPGYVAKYVCLLLLILVAMPLRLPPLCRSPARWWGMGTLLCVLLLGWLIRGSSTERLEGTFVNPNNYALAAMSVFCFIDHERDARWMRAASHALVALMILVSGTGGAMLGYLCGLCACVLRARSGRYRVAAAVTVVLLAALAATVLSGQGVGDAGQMRLLGPVCTKIRIVQENFADLAAGEELNFWNLGEEHGGEELTSALWRLSHWHDMVRVYAASGWPVRLLGHGLGSSAALVDNLPHNDYLRLLFEIGALGLLANLAVWFILYRRANPASRWIAVTMAVYAFTENNLDNFLVMGLFALFMVGAGGVQAAEPMRPPRSEETAAEATA